MRKVAMVNGDGVDEDDDENDENGNDDDDVGG